MSEDKLNIYIKSNKFIIDNFKEKINSEEFLDISNNIEIFRTESNSINLEFKHNDNDFIYSKKILNKLVNYNKKNLIKSKPKVGFLLSLYYIYNIISLIKQKPVENMKYKGLNKKKYKVIQQINNTRYTELYYTLFMDILQNLKKDMIRVAIRVPFEKNEKNKNDGYVILDIYRDTTLIEFKLLLIHNTYQVYVTNFIINFFEKIKKVKNYFNYKIFTKEFFINKLDVICDIFNSKVSNSSEIYINQSKSKNKKSPINVVLYSSLCGDKKKLNGYATFN